MAAMMAPACSLRTAHGYRRNQSAAKCPYMCLRVCVCVCVPLLAAAGRVCVLVGGKRGLEKSEMFATCVCEVMYVCVCV